MWHAIIDRISLANPDHFSQGSGSESDDERWNFSKGEINFLSELLIDKPNHSIKTTGTGVGTGTVPYRTVGRYLLTDKMGCGKVDEFCDLLVRSET